MSDRDTLLRMYDQNPEGLAIDLDVLFDECRSADVSEMAAFIEKHNAAIQKLKVLCGKIKVVADGSGNPMQEGSIVLQCQRKLSNQVARSALRYARAG